MLHRFVARGMFTNMKQPPWMMVKQKRLIRQMAFGQGLHQAEVTVKVGHHMSDITRLFVMRPAAQQGRPTALTA